MLPCGVLWPFRVDMSVALGAGVHEGTCSYLWPARPMNIPTARIILRPFMGSLLPSFLHVSFLR